MVYSLLLLSFRGATDSQLSAAPSCYQNTAAALSVSAEAVVKK